MPLWHKVKFLYSLLFQAVFLPSAEELDKMVSLTVYILYIIQCFLYILIMDISVYDKWWVPFS